MTWFLAAEICIPSAGRSYLLHNMEVFEDYYELLQVHHRAEKAVIEAAYRRLAHQYHPDHNGDPHASAHMKKLNIARDILCNPDARKEYDVIWFRHTQSQHTETGSAQKKMPDPELVVLPKYIRFRDLGYGEVKTTYFDIKNTGGPYTNYSIAYNSLPSWLEITDIQTLSNNVLPVRVYIKAIGQYRGNLFEYYIPVRLENSKTGYCEEVKVRVEMLMKAPVLQFYRKNLEFNVVPDSLPQPHIITLRNTGMRNIEGNLIPRQKWIKVSPRSFSFMEKQDVQIQIDAAKLYNDLIGYIDVKTNCGNEVLIVHVHVNRATSNVNGKKKNSVIVQLHECPECKHRSVRLDPYMQRYECLQCRSYWMASELACGRL